MCSVGVSSSFSLSLSTTRLHTVGAVPRPSRSLFFYRRQLGAWMLFAIVLSRLRPFYGVMLGTFVMSYMGNTVIEVSMRKGNKWLQR